MLWGYVFGHFYYSVRYGPTYYVHGQGQENDKGDYFTSNDHFLYECLSNKDTRRALKDVLPLWSGGTNENDLWGAVYTNDLSS